MVGMFELNHFSLNKQTPPGLRPALCFNRSVAGKLQGLKRDRQGTEKKASMTSVITFNSL